MNLKRDPYLFEYKDISVMVFDDQINDGKWQYEMKYRHGVYGDSGIDTKNEAIKEAKEHADYLLTCVSIADLCRSFNKMRFDTD